MIRTLRNLWRLMGIARILARHDALFVHELGPALPGVALVARLMTRKGVPGRPGQRLARALQEIGPTFIKLGQMLSTRPDLVGDPIAEDLSQLQDRLPPFPGTQARAIIEEQLGAPITALFAAFDDDAVAAASIAQVHFAVTAEGREVAVKVLRPGIEPAFRRDIDLFFWLAELAERTQPALRRLRLLEVVEVFDRTTQLEMDLRMEAAAATELAENFHGDETFYVPKVDWNRTSRHVLTLERVHGVKVDEVERIRAAGIDPNMALAHASAAFFNQVFRDGFFHADLHPGNMFVRGDSTIAVVDFGIMGRLDRATRYYLADMLLGFLNGDYRRVALVHFEAGFVPPHHSLEIFTQACRAIGEPVRNKALNEISVGRLLAQLFAVTEQFDMQTQPHLLLLQKSMLTAEGVGRTLNPNVNMWELARPLIEEWMREHRGPEARIVDEVESMIRAVRRLPDVLRETERAANQLSNGGLRLHPESVTAIVEGQSRRRRSDLWPVWGAIVVLTAAVIAALAV
ncbi:MAG TPA: 2-polyprenylphenol 6-hydroxylase [Azospirillaceae bacterium]|nr:2-polyprenylphenol 6-hydroxylase [Azospirillaceae bacterium]